MMMGKEALLGAWILVSAEIRRPDGSVERPLGASPTGVLIYTPNGRIAVQVSATERVRFKTDDIWDGTREELLAAFESYNAHFGRYDVHWDEKFVVHHVEGSLLPNWVGTDQVRYFNLDGDTLELKTPHLMAGSHTAYAVLVWKRDSA